MFAILPRMMDIAKEVERRRQLPAGRYLARLYVDRENNVSRNREYELGAKDLVGESEVMTGVGPPTWSVAVSLAAPR